jgi:hypothetical protein
MQVHMCRWSTVFPREQDTPADSSSCRLVVQTKHHLTVLSAETLRDYAVGAEWTCRTLQDINIMFDVTATSWRGYSRTAA